MKIVLKKDVAHVGQKGEVTEVSNGYGINYLIPRGLALKADSPQGLAYINRVMVGKDAATEAKKHQAEALGALVGEQFNLQVEANEVGGLFAKLTPGKVAQMLSSLTQTTLAAKNIKLESGVIEEVGEYNATLLSDDNEEVGLIMLNVTTQV